MTAPRPATTPAVRPWVVLLGLLALAANLRASLAGYPPLLETVRADLGTSAGVAGLVQAGAVLMMGAGSFAGPAFGARLGRETALGAAVGLVALGGLARGVPALAPLVAGSLLVGAGIGLAGVLISGVVKEHLAERAGAATGGYVVSMMVGATVSSAVAVPLAVGLGGWSLSLAVWAVPAVLAVAVWAPIGRRMPSSRGGTSALPWRDPFARLASLYHAGTSTMFYGWLTWLAPYYEGRGWTPTAAGLLLAVWSVTQIPAALFGPALAERRHRWRFWAGLTLACGLAGTLGAMVLPDAAPWLWPVLLGIGVGAGFPLGLTVIAWRSPDPAASAATTGLALGVGYTTAGVVPLLMGVLIDLTGGYPVALAVLLLAGAVQGVAIVRIGDRPTP